MTHAEIEQIRPILESAMERVAAMAFAVGAAAGALVHYVWTLGRRGR